MKTIFKSMILCMMMICVALTISCNNGSNDNGLQQDTYTITLTDDGNGSAVATVFGTKVVAAKAGTTVTLTATPAEGCLFDSWTTTSTGVTFADAAAAITTFVMPEGDVAINASFTANVKYDISISSAAGATVVATVGGQQVTQAEEGAIVTLNATPPSQCIFVKWTVVGGDVELADETANPATFTMPAESVTVHAEFVEVNGFDFITDPIFKEYCVGFDTDGDGYLSRQEAADVTVIDVNSSFGKPKIESLAGVEIFTNLKVLSCMKNKIAALDISKNTALTDLTCNGNVITELDVSKNSALELLACYANPLSALDVSNNIALQGLICSFNNLSVLDVSDNINLVSIVCDGNNLSALDVSKNIKLKQLICIENSISTLDISNNIELFDFDCSNNNLSTLDISKNEDLISFACVGNNLSANVLKTIFAALPERMAEDYAAIFCGNNPGSTEITADDAKVAEAKNWYVFYENY